MKKKTVLIFSLCLFSLFSFSQVYKFKSTETDVEKPGKNAQTKYEVNYHTFDFNKKRVIFEGTNSKGEKTRIVYPMKSFYKDGVTNVIVVNQFSVKEIWFSVAVNNLGYDLTDGTRLACYNITRLN